MHQYLLRLKLKSKVQRRLLLKRQLKLRLSCQLSLLKRKKLQSKLLKSKQLRIMLITSLVQLYLNWQLPSKRQNQSKLVLSIRLRQSKSQLNQQQLCLRFAACSCCQMKNQRSNQQINKNQTLKVIGTWQNLNSCQIQKHS